MFCFFFKQKTAYEMRISDWSSDVGSSDLLNRELMSMNPGSRAVPEIASASAELYQLSATMPGAKSENTNVAPADPSTLGPSGLNCAPTKTGWSLTSTEPQRSAANWATIRRCSPSVVPGLPATGVAGDGPL